MKRIMNCVVLVVLVMMLNVTCVSASDDGFVYISDEDSFDKCFKDESSCRLNNNIVVSSYKDIEKEITLDLNGYSLTPQENLKINGGLINVKGGAKLTITDSKKGGKISTGSSGNVWAAIQLKKDSSEEVAEVILDNGLLEGYYYGIVGNGNRNNTKTTINNGEIKCTNTEDCVGIYQPQVGEMLINNGTISGGTGIEIRSGVLKVKNGTIKGLSKTFTKTANKSGTTTNGAGIAVAQHTTKNRIDLDIYDGKISGHYAFYEWNPHDNQQTDLDKIHIHLYGGEFKTIDDDGDSVYSQDFTNFISGGTYNSNVNKYLTKDAKVTANIPNSKQKLDVKKKKKGTFILVSILIIIMGIIGIYFYKNKNQCSF